MMPPTEPMTLPRELDRSERSSDDAEAERIADLAELVESLLPSRRLLERWSPAAREESPEPPVEAHAESEDQSQKPITQPAKEVEQKAAESEGSTAPSQPATPAAPGPPRQRKADGDTADRESDATSTVNVPPDQWRRGRPLAARGLDIKTRRPVFPELTSLTARPGNPVVEIFFDRTGVPRRASIVRSSGDPRVDGPLVDALYRWRASGDVLKLLEGEELYRIELRILLGD